MSRQQRPKMPAFQACNSPTSLERWVRRWHLKAERTSAVLALTMRWAWLPSGASKVDPHRCLAHLDGLADAANQAEVEFGARPHQQARLLAAEGDLDHLVVARLELDRSAAGTRPRSAGARRRREARNRPGWGMIGRRGGSTLRTFFNDFKY